MCYVLHYEISNKIDQSETSSKFYTCNRLVKFEAKKFEEDLMVPLPIIMDKYSQNNE